MTIKQSTICTLIQGFPVLLILAQKYNKCLTTPFEYKPPSPTHSPEYYEALDALYHTLFGHGYEHGYDHGHDIYGYGDHGHGSGHHGYGSGQQGHDTTYHGYGMGHHGHGTSYHGHGTDHHGHGTSYHGNKYPGSSYGSKPSYGSSYKPYHGYPVHHGHTSHGVYHGVKKMYNHTGVKGHTTYAPNQTYNVHKYKVVVKKPKRGHRGHRGHKRRSGKIEGK
ncbi:uncharacterized protein LOC135081911 [Ostrinia nubilalis]|uniref:uncharacterized protein LOC135081911 n=1 Tax=Ostrinia nubilalis TaxID=29057 RepID=UPI00308247A1